VVSEKRMAHFQDQCETNFLISHTARSFWISLRF